MAELWRHVFIIFWSLSLSRTLIRRRWCFQRERKSKHKIFNKRPHIKRRNIIMWALVPSRAWNRDNLCTVRKLSQRKSVTHVVTFTQFTAVQHLEESDMSVVSCKRLQDNGAIAPPLAHHSNLLYLLLPVAALHNIIRITK